MSKGGDAGPDAKADGGAAPDTMIKTGPAQYTTATTATFTIESTPANLPLLCALDDAPYASCTANPTLTGVGEGQHTFHAKAVNGGTEDPTPASYIWVVDTMAPNTTITDKPADPSATSEATFKFSCTDPNAGTTFKCTIDGKAEEDCTSGKSYSQLAIGSHTFTVACVDKAGNKDATPDSYTWQVTASTPQTSATVNGVECINGKNVTAVKPDDIDIAFTSDVNNSTFKCGTDGDPDVACTSPQNPTYATDGEHSFTVVASAGGTADPSPISCIFTIISSPPVVTITKPGNGPIGPNQEYTFTVDATGPVTVVCKLNGEKVDCPDGSYQGTNLTGTVTFEVTATDQAGNTGSDSTTNTVATDLPTLQLMISPLFQGHTAPNGSFTFVLDNPTKFPNATFHCVVSVNDGVVNDVPNCVSPVSFMNLADGDKLHIVVTATDPTSGATADTSADAIVDGKCPEVLIISPQANQATGSPVILEWMFATPDDEADANVVECTSSTGINPTPCAPLTPVDILIDQSGDLTLSVIATDHLGNTCKTTVQNTVTVPVDVDGPTVELVVPPPAGSFNQFGEYVVADEVCPSSAADTAIHFTCNDAAGNEPCTFTCILDGIQESNCTDGLNSGVFNWTRLIGGEHTLQIISYDNLGNPGPKNNGAPDHVGVIVKFVVDRTPPVINLDVVSDLLGDNGLKVTSGGGGIGGYGDFDVTVTDTGHDVNSSDIHCYLDPQNATNADTDPTTGVPCGGNYDAGFTFSNLEDDNTGGAHPHHVFIVAQDVCGNINQDQVSEAWWVDSTANEITFNDFTPANKVEASGVTGPAGDIVDSDAFLHFTLFDDASDGFPGESPLDVTCDVDGNSITCPEDDSSPTTPDVTRTYTVSLNSGELSDGSHTFNLSTTDGVGNQSTDSLTFTVDGSAPTLAITVDNPNDCTVSGTSEPMTQGTGHISFTSADVGAAGNVTWVCTVTQPNLKRPAPVFTLPAPVTCGPSDDPSTCNCTPTHGYDFSGFPAGDYQITISATDAVSNNHTESVTWRVDTSPPVVTFVSPPNARDDGGNFPSIVPFFILSAKQPGTPAPVYGDETGTFTVDVDLASMDATHPILECSVTGTGGADPVDCDATFNESDAYNGTYTIPGTVDNTIGGHTTVITATDCVGNEQTYTSTAWSADKLPPAELSAPTVSTNDSGGNALARGSVRITFNVEDDVTNVDSISCDLDGILDSCGTFENGQAPTSGRSFTDTMQYDELSAGPHRLTYTVSDVWGHSATYTFDFNVSLGDNLGHVTLIGHDYEALSVEPPSTFGPQTDETRNIIGNAAHQTAARSYERPIRIKIMALPGTHDAEAGNVQTALKGRLSDFGTNYQEFDWNPVSADAAITNIGAELRGMDVLILLDANSPPTYSNGNITDPGDAGQLGASSTWINTLHTYAVSGGIVVDTDGTIFSSGVILKKPGTNFNALSENYRMLGNRDIAGPTPLLGVDQPEAIDAGFSFNSVIGRECNNVNELTLGDFNGETFDRIDQYQAPLNTVRYRAYDLQAARLLSNYFQTDGGDCTLPQEGCETKYVVLDRIYAPPTDFGPVHLNAWRDGHKADDNVVAVYHDPTGAVLVDTEGNEVICQLDPDGTASYDRAQAGGMLTVVDRNAYQYQDSSTDRLQTAQAIAIADSITFGSIYRDRDGNLNGTTQGDFPDCDIAACEALDHYYVTNGCDDNPPDGNSFGLFTNGQCIYQNDDFSCNFDTGCVMMLVEARDANDNVLAYTTVTDVDDNNQNFWSVSAGDFSSWQAARTRSIPASGSFPQGVTGNIISMVSLGELKTGLGAIFPRINLNERDSGEPQTRDFFATAADDSFGQSFHHWMGIEYTVASSRSEVSAVIRDMAMPGSNNVTADLTTVLPRIKTAQITTGGARSIVHYQSDAAPTSLSTSKGGWTEISFTGPCENSIIWQMTFPPTGDSGDVQYPELPPINECIGVSGDPFLIAVGFCDPANLTVGELRQDFLGVCEPAYDGFFGSTYDSSFDRHPTAKLGGQLRVTGSYGLTRIIDCGPKCGAKP